MADQLTLAEMMKIKIPRKSLYRIKTEKSRRRRGRNGKKWTLTPRFEEESQKQIQASLKKVLEQRNSSSTSQSQNQNHPSFYTQPGAAVKPQTGTENAPSKEKEEAAADDISIAEKSLLQKLFRERLVDSNSVFLEIRQKDPNSTLYSATSFEDLPLRPELLTGIFGMGFHAPSRIQEKALPILFSNPPQNLILQSQSGTGKTAAFVLAMLSRVDPKVSHPQVLCLSPTYELALQTGEVIKQMGKFCPEITVKFAVRGVEIPFGEECHEHIIIGTPGKIMDLGLRHKFFALSKIKVFVLDEADVMIATQGYRDASIKIHGKLPRDCQMMLFSATYDAEVMQFAENLIPDSTVMRLKREEESLDNIKQYYIVCRTKEEKYRAIANIYGVITVGQAMIFCQTKKTAAWLAGTLTKDGHSVALLSGDLTVDQRLAVLNRFRDSIERILITTNVMARGIDVEQVTLVVNFDLPVDMKEKADCETYLHRIGRTGRFGKSGIAINLVDGPRSMEVLGDIENHFGRPVYKLDSENVAELEKLED